MTAKDAEAGSAGAAERQELDVWRSLWVHVQQHVTEATKRLARIKGLSPQRQGADAVGSGIMGGLVSPVSAASRGKVAASVTPASSMGGASVVSAASVLQRTADSGASPASDAFHGSVLREMQAVRSRTDDLSSKIDSVHEMQARVLGILSSAAAQGAVERVAAPAAGDGGASRKDASGSPACGGGDASQCGVHAEEVAALRQQVAEQAAFIEQLKGALRDCVAENAELTSAVDELRGSGPRSLAQLESTVNELELLRRVGDVDAAARAAETRRALEEASSSDDSEAREAAAGGAGAGAGL